MANKQKKLLPKPPEPPPNRTFRCGLLGDKETKESIKLREDYEIYMRGYRDGLGSV